MHANATQRVPVNHWDSLLGHIHQSVAFQATLLPCGEAV
jgi:hypothetical protein